MEKLDLKNVDGDSCIMLKDSTVYEIIGIDMEQINLSQSIFARWISRDDAEAEVEELSDDYFWDEPSGVLLVDGVCGKSTLNIGGQDRKAEIVSRFRKIDYNELAKMVLHDEDAKKNYRKMLSVKYRNKIPGVMSVDEGYELSEEFLFDMPILYEVYVRALLANALKSSATWKLVDEGPRTVCMCNDENDEKASFAPPSNGHVDVPYDVYLEGEIIPDIVIRNEDEVVILDVKYKKGSYNLSTRSDRFQILAYAYMWNCRKVGHIFPEKKSDDTLIIECIGGKEMLYHEFNVAEEQDICAIVEYLDLEGNGAFL